jgi:hypothetical protein
MRQLTIAVVFSILPAIVLAGIFGSKNNDNLFNFPKHDFGDTSSYVGQRKSGFELFNDPNVNSFDKLRINLFDTYEKQLGNTWKHTGDSFLEVKQPPSLFKSSENIFKPPLVEYKPIDVSIPIHQAPEFHVQAIISRALDIPHGEKLFDKVDSLRHDAYLHTGPTATHVYEKMPGGVINHHINPDLSGFITRDISILDKQPTVTDPKEGYIPVLNDCQDYAKHNFDQNQKGK